MSGHKPVQWARQCRTAGFLVVAWSFLWGCSPPITQEPIPTLDEAAETQSAVPESTAPRPELSDVGMALFGPLAASWSGDLNGMVERRVVRVLVVPTRTQYWIHDGRPLGIEYERMRAFEKWLNKRYKTDHRHLHVHVVFIPTRRDDLVPALLDGRGDIAVGMLTSTADRLKEVDFAGPFLRDISELPVTRDTTAAFSSVDDLAGLEFVVRPSSSYWSHLVDLNQRLIATGRLPVRMRAATETLTDDDLLEMVSAGLVDATVVDDYAARLWSGVFSNLRLHDQAPVNAGGELGWLIRRGSPRLAADIAEFARSHGQGTLFGNSLMNKYTQEGKFLDASLSDDGMTRFRGTYAVFRKYAEQYSLDPLLLVAQGYQESRLRQAARSHRGAIGIMQLMPATGRAMGVGDISSLEQNVHAGAKYVRSLTDLYFSDPGISELNRTLFAFAAYNAGPARIRRIRSMAERRGLDPDVWFNNVELIAAEQIGPETVRYVANIYKYYVAYTLALYTDRQREEARARQSVT
jgi:membrane-bound lytic murein transglycosylase MltF